MTTLMPDLEMIKMLPEAAGWTEACVVTWIMPLKLLELIGKEYL